MPRKKKATGGTIKEKSSEWKGGAKALDRWLWENHVQVKQLAERTGLSTNTISSYKIGRRYPTILAALLIERETGMPPSVWVDPADLVRAC